MQKVIDSAVGNTSLIKVKQIVKITEILKVIKTAKTSDYTIYISHRSSKIANHFIADLIVKTSAAPCRREWLTKYNQFLPIEEKLGSKTRYAYWRNFQPTFRT
ncbi:MULTISPECIES: hypothetical protein [unclassified Okeania]|uniref:hypothetical protein n=1 Tax=unclassified Okeania TaxID=2634635 RepID=UPI00338EEBA1